MIEVWILEADYAGEDCTEMYLHLKHTDIWITDTGYSGELLQDMAFNESIFTNKVYLFTNLGEL